jgi:hypothetical protein
LAELGGEKPSEALGCAFVAGLLFLVLLFANPLTVVPAGHVGVKDFFA